VFSNSARSCTVWKIISKYILGFSQKLGSEYEQNLSLKKYIQTPFMGLKSTISKVFNKMSTIPRVGAVIEA